MMAKWVLLLMLALQPNAPWRDTYESTAQTIATASNEKSVYKTPERTAALLVSLAWFESKFNQRAINRMDPGGGSFGLFQASRVPMPNVRDQANGAIELIGVSFRVCGNLGVELWLSQYASGGGKCFSTGDAAIKSEHRMRLAFRLLKEHPYHGE